MLKRNFHQILSFIGYVLIPFLLCFNMIINNLYIDNITSILTNPIAKIIAIMILIYFSYLLNLQYIKHNLIIAYFLLTAILIIFDYDLNDPLFSLIHVLSGYIALFIFHYLICKILSNKQLKIYYLISGLCFFLIIYYGSIIGLAEVLYISSSSILLTKRKTG